MVICNFERSTISKITDSLNPYLNTSKLVGIKKIILVISSKIHTNKSAIEKTFIVVKFFQIN